MKNIILIIITIGFIISQAFSQNLKPTLSPVILNATGGWGNHHDKYFEWSVGEETVIETMSSVNSIITHGILQPIGQIPNRDKCWGPEEIKIYPNPTRDFVSINFFSVQTGKISLTLFDASGRLMGTRQFDYYGFGHIERMDLSRFAAGLYILNIRLEPTGKSVRKNNCPGFKIIKLN